MILVTGGTGFLGSALVRKFRELNMRFRAVGQPTADLTSLSQTISLVHETHPDAIVHLAARVGGIGANRKNPATFWRDNLLMGVNILEAARLAKTPKVVMVGTTCSYPKVPPSIPFMEANLFDGYPEETNAPYGIAKRALLVGAQAYRAEYAMNVVTMIPTNLYGPGDHFDLETSHVIPAMIQKFHEAKERKAGQVVLWGTGRPTRDFLYVEDCADALARAIQSYDRAEPINLGSGIEVSMRALAGEIAGVVGFGGEVVWDESRPDGQPRRCLSTARAGAAFGWEASTPLSVGLTRTYRAFLEETR